MIRLSSRWAQYLVSQPEAGMGYQIVTIVLKDGRRFDQVDVVEEWITRIRGLDGIPFAEEEIARMIVTNDRWH